MAKEKIDNIYEFYKNGQLRSVRKYKAGLPFGKWVWYYENGSSERVIYHTKDGKVKMVIGKDKNGVETREIEREWDENGVLAREWLRFEKTAELRGWYENGQPMYESYLRRECDENGVVREYKDGVRVRWWPDGTLREEEHYVNGKEEGISWRIMYDGTKEVCYYEDGKCVAKGAEVEDMKVKAERAVAHQIKQAKLGCLYIFRDINKLKDNMPWLTR